KRPHKKSEHAKTIPDMFGEGVSGSVGAWCYSNPRNQPRCADGLEGVRKGNVRCLRRESVCAEVWKFCRSNMSGPVEAHVRKQLPPSSDNAARQNRNSQQASHNQ